MMPSSPSVATTAATEPARRIGSESCKHRRGPGREKYEQRYEQEAEEARHDVRAGYPERAHGVDHARAEQESGSRLTDQWAGCEERSQRAAP